MATRSSIEWTDATWGPTVGCHKVSPGCKHCYAEVMHARLTKMGQPKYAEPFRVVKPHPESLAAPLSWRKPRRVFVNSMSDLFHEDIPNEYIAAVFGVMAATPQHTYQILTKRAERLPEWFGWAEVATANRYKHPALIEHAAVAAGRDDRLFAAANRAAGRGVWPLPNVWLGVSVENQEQADARIPRLLSVPAAVRFVSAEPLLEAVDFNDGRDWLTPVVTKPPGAARLDWVIVGGESGHGARPFDLAWARSTVEQCREAGVPVFVKQLGADPRQRDGAATPGYPERYPVPVKLLDRKGGDPSEWPEDLRVREWPRAAGVPVEEVGT